MKHLYIIQWELCAKNGLSVSYSLNGVNQFISVDNWQAARLLSNCNLIQGRKKVNDTIMVAVANMWVSFEFYIDTCSFLPCEVRALVVEHLEIDAIVNAPFSLLSFKEEFCLN